MSKKIPCVLNKQIETKVCKELGLTEIYGGSRIGKEDNDKKDYDAHFGVLKFHTAASLAIL